MVSEGPDLKLQASGNQTVRVIGILESLTESKTVKAIKSTISPVPAPRPF